jgi:hypothetical protein
MKFILKADELTFFIGTKADVRPVNSYENGENKGQKKDEASGLPVWSVNTEMIQGEEVEAVSLKIVSALAPELSARTEYKAKGVLTLSPYVNSNNNRSAVSLTLTGTLEKATALPRLENKQQ